MAWHAGAAYVFVRSGPTWTEEAKLLAPDGEENDYFGGNLAIEGDVILAGVSGDNDLGDYSGSVHVFRRSAGVWTHEQKILAPDGMAGDEFGHSVSLAGDTAAIGAPYADVLASSSGAVYVFARTGGVWSQQAKLFAPDGAYGDDLGASVAISGDALVAGAPWKDGAEHAEGAAYVFVRSGVLWSQEAKLLAPDPGQDAYFGRSVSLDGDHLEC